MDTVFDGLGGADGAAIFKASIEKGMEKGLATEIEKDVKTLGHALESGAERKPNIPEFPPERRVNYQIKDSHWTPRGTGLDEADPMFREIYLQQERLPKDDFAVRYGEKPVMTAEGYSGRWFFENDYKLKNKTIKAVRKDVSTKKPGMMCEIKNDVVKVVKKGMDMLQRKNVDHAVECQMHVA